MKAAVVTRESQLPRAIRSSRQIHERRTEVAVVVASGGVFGVGTVSPQPVPLMGDPGLTDVLEALRNIGLSRVGGIGRTRDGRNWAQVHALFGDQPRDRWASAAIEAAILDLDCEESGQSISMVLGEGETSFQAVTSLIESSVTISKHASRYRVKVARHDGIDFSSLSQLNQPVILDFNGDVLGVGPMVDLVSVASQHADIVAIEQAWAVGDFTLPAQLRAAGLRLSHDESIRSVNDLRHAVRYQAIDIAAIKPARCGGVAVAREIARRAHASGVEYYVGGFFEGPLGRFRNHKLASSLSAGPSDVLHTVTGDPVTEQEARQDRADWIALAQQMGEWIDVGG